MRDVYAHHEQLALLALTPEELQQQPHRYFERLTQIPQLPAPTGEPRYASQWGCLTFEELYQRTYRYMYKVLQSKETVPIDQIEDGLQIGYLRLWQRLEANPNLLLDKPMAWLAKFMYYSALLVNPKTQQRITTTSDLQADADIANRVALDEITIVQKKAVPKARQSDTMIDIMEAITATANHVLTLPSSKEQDRMLWALYSLTALDVQVTEAAKLFGVNHHRSMKRAYAYVRADLQSHLQAYRPHGETHHVHNRGQKTLPKQDITAIRLSNQNATPAHFEAARQYLEVHQPDTLPRDLIALTGIQEGIAATEQGRRHAISKSSIQRAYERAHLLLAAQRDPSIVPRRMERKRAQAFTLTQSMEALLVQIANEFVQGDDFVSLIALYGYICNLPNRAVSRAFNVNEGTLRRYRHQVQGRLVGA